MRQTQLKTQRSSRYEAWGILGVRNVAAGQPVDPAVVCAWQRGSLFDRPLPHPKPLKTWEGRGYVKLQVLGSATSAHVVSRLRKCGSVQRFNLGGRARSQPYQPATSQGLIVKNML